jgi:STIMATE family
VFFVIVIVPLVLNTLQFVIQDTFLKKNDFEITDVDVMKKYYDCTDAQELETSLTQTRESAVSIELKQDSDPKASKPNGAHIDRHISTTAS